MPGDSQLPVRLGVSEAVDPEDLGEGLRVTWPTGLLSMATRMLPCGELRVAGRTVGLTLTPRTGDTVSSHPTLFSPRTGGALSWPHNVPRGTLLGATGLISLPCRTTGPVTILEQPLLQGCLRRGSLGVLLWGAVSRLTPHPRLACVCSVGQLPGKSGDVPLFLGGARSHLPGSEAEGPGDGEVGWRGTNWQAGSGQSWCLVP